MNFKDIIKNIPKTPGVYHFLDKDETILYIGKAKNINNRVKQYFQKELNRGPWIDEMMKLAADIRFIETESEIEAVLLEAELINKLKPRFNSRLKDDKSFLVIKIDRKKDFPCVELARFKNVDFKDKSAEYYGPYPSGDLLKKSLRYLRKVFPFRDCSTTKFNIYRKKGRPCIYADIKVCPAPCCDQTEKNEYDKNLRYLKSFLKGKKKHIISVLEKEMKSLSKKQKFEEAAILRNKINALNHIKNVAIGLRDEPFNMNKLLFKRIECYDISDLPAGRQASLELVVGSMVVFSNGKPDKDEYRKFKIKNSREIAGQGDIYWLKEMIERRFKNDWPKPDLIVIDGGPVQLRVAKEVLESLNLNIAILSISKGPERKNNDFHYGNQSLAQIVEPNSSLKNILIQTRDEAHRFAINFYRRTHLKKMFE